MTALNTVNLVGRNTTDIEVRKTQSGLSVAAFTLAVNGRQKDETDFISIVAWRQVADFLGQYAEKGCLLSVNGSIKTRSYEKDGQKVHVTEVIADDVRILAHNAKKTQNEYSTVPQQNRSQMPQKQPSQPSTDNGFPTNFGIDINSDDLPF